MSPLGVVNVVTLVALVAVLVSRDATTRTQRLPLAWAAVLLALVSLTIFLTEAWTRPNAQALVVVGAAGLLFGLTLASLYAAAYARVHRPDRGEAVKLPRIFQSPYRADARRWMVRAIHAEAKYVRASRLLAAQRERMRAQAAVHLELRATIARLESDVFATAITEGTGR